MSLWPKSVDSDDSDGGLVHDPALGEFALSDCIK